VNRAHNLTRLLQPRSIAIVGLSSDPHKHGGRVLSSLRKFGYPGQVWGVNPRGGTIAGLDTYPSLRDVPGSPDAVVMAVPGTAALEIIEQAGEVNAGGAIIFGGGFAEAGAEGKARQDELRARARASGVRVLGPNSAGLIDASSRTVMSFLTCLERPADQLRPGPVGLVTQSGGSASFLHNLAAERGSGLAVSVSTGNEADVAAGEAMSALIDRPDVASIALVLETIRDGAAFIAAARAAVAAGKPVVVCKLGRSEAGERVMQTHTASMALPWRRIAAVFDALGITVTATPEELFDVAELMARSRMPAGPGVAVVTHSGGTAVLLADGLETEGITLPQPSPALRRNLGPYLQFGASGNPTDLGGIITEPKRYTEVVRHFLGDDGYDLAVAVSTPHPRAHSANRAGELAELAASSTKPLINLWLAGDLGADGLDILRAAGAPVSTNVTSVVRAVGGLMRLRELRQTGPQPRTRTAPALPIAPADGHELTEPQAKTLLRSLGLPTPRFAAAGTVEEAVRAADSLGYPVAVKVVSPDIAHKSDIGGVRLDLRDADAVRLGCAAIDEGLRRHAPNAADAGYLVEEYAPGVEVVLGVVHDRAFGPIVLIGSGGVLAEAIDDVALGLPPLSESQALRMIRSLRMYPVLRGFRGSPPVDESGLARMLVRLGDIALDYDGVIDELDLNPVIFSAGQWRIADALIRFRTEDIGLVEAPQRAVGERGRGYGQAQH
jgi:acetate---CoA ligase (ADP-forming)